MSALAVVGVSHPSSAVTQLGTDRQGTVEAGSERSVVDSAKLEGMLMPPEDLLLATDIIQRRDFADESMRA